MMKKIFIIMISICLIVAFSGCNNVDARNSLVSDDVAATVASNNPNMTKYEIDLTLDNYYSYFDITTSIYNGQSPYKFAGCLSYALYDNVSVFFTYTTTYSSGGQEAENVVLKLNANGNGNAPVKKGGVSVELVGISGRVIFWI